VYGDGVVVSLNEPSHLKNAPQRAGRCFRVRHFVRAAEHTLVLTGELDVASCPALNAAVAEVCTDATTGVVLDLRKLTFIDSSGIHAVLVAQQLCAEHECEFRIVPGQAQVQGVFEITGLLDRLPFRASAPIGPGAMPETGGSVDVLAERDRANSLREDYRMMLLVHDQGVNARLEGLPCRPPDGYDVAIGLDLVEVWTAGWEGADRQLAGQSKSSVS
jgi:anti-anti-sigma factor